MVAITITGAMKTLTLIPVRRYLKSLLGEVGFTITTVDHLQDQMMMLRL
jgi:hypothetical protein